MSGINISGRRTKIFVWLTFFLQVVILPAGAQNYFFDNYSITQGLSAQKVYTLLQDSKDYIWLGTRNGLSRFDGKKFEDFTSHKALAPDGVRCMIEDSMGYIWFGHLNGGISRYNGRIFERVSFDSLDLKGDITSIAQINDNIWFTSYGEGVIKADFPVADIRHIKAKQFIGGKDNLSDLVVGSGINRDGSFICLAEFPDIVASKRYNKKENRFENYRMPSMTTDFSTSCLLEDSKGNRWFGTYYGGLYKYNMSESRMDTYDLIKMGVPSNAVSCLTEDHRGRIWVGTWGGGIAVFDGDSISIFNESNGLKATRIYDIIEDVENNILIADETNGLTLFKGDAFVTFNDKEILPDPNVNTIFEDKSGRIWFGTNKGIVQYFPGSKKNPVLFNDGLFRDCQEIKSIRADRNGNLWIGATNPNHGEVIFYNTTTSEFEAKPDISSSFYYGGQLKAMEIDRQNNLWIGTNNGVFIGTIDKNNFSSRPKNKLDSIEVDAITTLYCDPKGGMWIGTVKNGEKPSLFKFIAPGKDISAVTNNDFKQVSALSGVEPTALVMDARGVLWVGTNAGLIELRNDSVVSTITENDGLLSNLINLLAVGKDGSIYIGTNSGLNRYFPESKRIFSFTERNGFTGILTRTNAVYESPGGDLWFGTANGATRLIPDKMLTKELEPLTHILSMRVNYEEETREMVQGMKLKYSEGSILFDYYSVCLTNPDVVRYQVKLEGADKDWQPVTDQPRANYPALAFGKYTFMVKACNSQGVWNSKPATFSFIIKPPFYLTWWFILISLCTIVISVITYIRIREQNLIKEKIILENKVKERTAEVVQKSQIIEEKNRDITASIRYAERIQRAMLPPAENYAEIFVIYMPKDIVSGDFYWMYDNGDNLLIAAVDCTGHGVPGAFMSIIGHNSLNKVVGEYGLTRPSAILDQLNNEVNKAILQSQEKGINDGMDLTLISYHKNTRTVEMAGAYNPLYQVRNGEVIVHKTDRFAIGMQAFDQKKGFTNFKIDIQPGDMLYMASDGYADQFGSGDVKKFKTVNLKRVLSEVSSLPVAEQKIRMENEIIEWKGELSQVDDIMIIGMRVPH